MKRQIEDYEEILQKVKEIVPMTVELHPDDFNLPSAICVINFDFLYDLKSFKGTNKLMVFDIYWGCVYPEKQLFVLEFWEAVNTTGKIFEMYLTPQQIKHLIKILRKGLEYLKKYGKNNKKEEVGTCQQ